MLNVELTLAAAETCVSGSGLQRWQRMSVGVGAADVSDPASE